jgi:SAM-dependent methyltransferase
MNAEWERTAKAVEFGWWKKELDRMGMEAFKESRKSYFADMISGFNDKFKPNGIVFNVGTGLISIFNFICTELPCPRGVEVDPLADQYQAIISQPCAAFAGCTEELADKSADTVICFNTIDHTSEPEKMVSEIYRIMKDDGTLYLEVNTDRYDSPAHYQKFSKELIQKLFGDKFKIVFESTKKDCGPLKNWDENYAMMVKA